jgi:hypothetical protein
MDIPSVNRENALERLRNARSAHLKWCAYAQELVSGVSVDVNKIPIEHTLCDFGIWYHGVGKEELGHLSAYDSIYAPHEMLHEIYKRIYKLLHSDDCGDDGFTQINNYMDELIGVSETLQQTLDVLEQEIQQLPEK